MAAKKTNTTTTRKGMSGPQKRTMGWTLVGVLVGLWALSQIGVVQFGSVPNVNMPQASGGDNASASQSAIETGEERCRKFGYAVFVKWIDREQGVARCRAKIGAVHQPRVDPAAPAMSGQERCEEHFPGSEFTGWEDQEAGKANCRRPRNG